MLLLNPFRFEAPTPPAASGFWIVISDFGANYQISSDGRASWDSFDLSTMWDTPQAIANIVNHLGLWVTANYFGLDDDVITSSDNGATWANEVTPSSVSEETYGWTALASNGTVVVAVGDSDDGKGMIYSSDGETWAFGTDLGGVKAWQSVVWCAELSLFVASSSDSSQNMATSSNGSTWTLRTATATSCYFPPESNLAWNGTRLVRWGRNNSTNVLVYFHSTNGTSWTLTTTAIVGSGDLYPSSLLWDGSQFVLLVLSTSGSYVITSSDGTSWVEGDALPARCATLAFDGTTYVAVKDDNSGTYYTSTDLTTWDTETNLPAGDYTQCRTYWIEE